MYDVTMLRAGRLTRVAALLGLMARYEATVPRDGKLMRVKTLLL
jgi:hypothetical protein